MILGYQVQDQHGSNWANRPSYQILTPETAIKELKLSRVRFNQDNYKIIAVLEGDIENPKFENVLTLTADQYTALSVSSSHITKDDRDVLGLLSDNSACNMIMRRDTGWFIKLYDEADMNFYPDASPYFDNILVSAFNAGFTMVEIDGDARMYDQFQVFEW